MYTQVLDIKYNSRALLEKYLEQELGNKNFIVKAYMLEKWTIEIPEPLSNVGTRSLLYIPF
ncbi:hypothetical protein GGR58DRAFT_468098 [Xylaria digitata]|nr:hypothetical protein GGR58DRAFT_468098 [Xylaria digitata]